MATDIKHAYFPVGPVGKPTELQLFFNQMIFKYTKYPKAAKEFLRFMMEKEQIDPWLQASIGYVTPALRLREEPDLDRRPEEHAVPRFDEEHDSVGATRASWAMRRRRARGLHRRNMVAEAASGSKTPKEAAERAQKRAERYYKV